MKGHISESEVPAAVMNSFNTKYPGATDVKWERETEDSRIVYEAEFKMSDNKMEAFWDEAGNFVREDND